MGTTVKVRSGAPTLSERTLSFELPQGHDWISNERPNPPLSNGNRVFDCANCGVMLTVALDGGHPVDAYWEDVRSPYAARTLSDADPPPRCKR